MAHLDFNGYYMFGEDTLACTVRYNTAAVPLVLRWRVTCSGGGAGGRAGATMALQRGCLLVAMRNQRQLAQLVAQRAIQLTCPV